MSETNYDCYENLQVEDSNEECENDINPDDVRRFDDAVIWGTDWTSETIATQLKKGTIDLYPTFQRRDAWTDVEKSKFIESLMLGLPVPPIILAENKQKKNSYIVIDGKQRLLSIRRFYSDVSENKIKNENLNPENVFKQLKLKGLDILNRFNGKTYESIINEEEDYINRLENQPIRTIVIKNWPNESFLYTVFLRLNTGSKKLSPQELRQALHPGDFLTYLDDVTAKSIIMQKVLNNKNADSRMRDVELALRYYSYKYFLENYNGNLKNFLDNTCKSLNKRWEQDYLSIQQQYTELESAIDFTMSIFGDKSPFSRYTMGKSNNRFSRAIYEIFTFYFSIPEIRNTICTESDKKELFDSFVSLNDDMQFNNAVNDTTKELNKVVCRFDKMAQMLLGLKCISQKGIEIQHPVLKDGKIIIENTNS